MRTTVKFFSLCALTCVLAGCTSTITNLSPSQQVRSPSGLYHLEAEWDSAKQSVVKDSLKAYVMVGAETYPMQPTPMVRDRWETMVPVPADQSLFHYRYKFDYEYRAIPNRRENSKLSTPFTLKILDK